MGASEYTAALPSWRYFSSDRVPERDRLAVLNDAFGNSAFPCGIVPNGDDPLYMAGYAIALPGLFITHGINRGVTYQRTAQHVGTQDTLMLAVTLGGHYRVKQSRGEFMLQPGEGWVAATDEPAMTALNVAGQTRESVSLMLPRAAFADARLDMGTLLRRPLACDNDAMHLLLAYIRGIESSTAPMPPALQHRAVEHVYDLALLALGGCGDAADEASGRSLPAARLRSLKEDITHHIASGQPLHLPQLAARHGISTVYVQKLFERNGTSFSAFVLGQRLEHVRRQLCNPRFARRKISDIVFDAGFGNLSWFNRAFRRRYSMTPSDMRAAAATGNHAVPHR